MTPLLDTIDYPQQLRLLDRRQLAQLAKELRCFLVESVARTGGHLASNLGVVELTIALHYVFNTPDDKLVWDVGHQTYPHKILTGRRNKMQTLRKPQGIAGFPRRCESEYDTFGTGHSSTSISAALGMAVAAQKTGSARRSVAITQTDPILIFERTCLTELDFYAFVSKRYFFYIRPPFT